jgi:predicted transposase YbfD/YdcC
MVNGGSSLAWFLRYSLTQFRSVCSFTPIALASVAMFSDFSTTSLAFSSLYSGVKVRRLGGMCVLAFDRESYWVPYPEVAGPFNLTGQVITADAAHPSPDTAAYVIRRLGEYVLTVKANKPALLAAIAERLPNPITVPAAHVESERRSGFIVRRSVWTAPACDLDYPGASQVFRIRRETFDLAGCRIRNEYVHGVTSLPAVSAALIACFVRGHWGIEDKIHWVRDVLFAEDHHRAFLGGVAQTMAAIRNLAIGLIRLAGHSRIKQVLERNHGDKTAMLTLLAASRPKIN